MKYLKTKLNFKVVLFMTGIIIISLNYWNADDAYHGFAMVRNLAEGNGLVYNIGERVNAATCPLYILALSIVYLVTHNIIISSFICGVGFTGASIYLLIFKICKEKKDIGISIILLFLSYSFICFSTSGLENPLLFFLATLFYMVLFKTDEMYSKKLFLLSFIFSLLITTRMDVALIFIPSLVDAFLIRRKGKIKLIKSIIIGIGGLFPFIIWEIFSIIYYGFPFPNTFYAKLTTGINESIYVKFALQYFKATFLLDILVMLIPIIFIIVSIVIIKRNYQYVLIGIGFLLYNCYLIYIGGDFMVGRHNTVIYWISILLLNYIIDEFKDVIKSKAEKFALVLIFIGGIWGTSVAPLGKLLLYSEERGNLMAADERNYYFPFTGGIPILNAWLHKEDPVDFKRWNMSEPEYLVNDTDYKGEVMGFAPGIAMWYYGDKLYLSDPVALGDPLLARMPTILMTRTGHISRQIPIGYKETVRFGDNCILDDNLHEYYDIMCTITKGEIWSRERIKTIINMNLGKYNYLIENYIKNEKSNNKIKLLGISDGFQYIGEREGNKINAIGDDYYVLWGPYIKPQSGVYNIYLNYKYTLNDSDINRSTFDVCINNGTQLLGVTQIETNCSQVVLTNIAIEDAANNVEYRVWLQKGSEITIESIELEYLHK